MAGRGHEDAPAENPRLQLSASPLADGSDASSKRLAGHSRSFTVSRSFVVRALTGRRTKTSRCDMADRLPDSTWLGSRESPILVTGGTGSNCQDLWMGGLALHCQLPPDLSFVPVVGGCEASGGGCGGCVVVRVDVGDDGRHGLLPKPGDEGSGSFGGDASSLPDGSYHPGDLRGASVGAGGDRRLDRIHQAGVLP